MESTWPNNYPSQDSLKREINAMASAVVEAICAQVPQQALYGIYLKGSANRDWDSPVDYVPEISDVDIHVWFREGAIIGAWQDDIEKALFFQENIENGYRARVPSPVHLPRPQIVILNELLQLPDYSPTPPQCITALVGQDYPIKSYDEAHERELARQHILESTQILGKLALGIIDKPGPYLQQIIRKELSWRISPTGPRLLVLAGMPAIQAWALNRTQVIEALQKVGRIEIAEAYGNFYLSGWQWFLSKYTDSAAARAMVRAGVTVLQQACMQAPGVI
jgi:hypothetical protein